MAIEKVTCDWCGREFAAVPDSFTEGGLNLMHMVEPGEEWKSGDDGHTPTMDPDSLPDNVKADIMHHFKIDPEQFRTLMKTGKVRLAMTICPKCQNQTE